MPLVKFNTKADFDAAYSIRAENGHPNNRPKVKLNYHRAVMLPICQRRADAIVNIFSWPTNSVILMVGSGFAWTAEILEQQYNYNNIICIDTSDWIQSEKDNDEEQEINDAIQTVGLDPTSGEGLNIKNNLHSPGNRRRHSRDIRNESLSNRGSRNRIKNILGNIEIALTESVLEALTDQEIIELSNNIKAINNNIQIYHLITPKGAGVRQDPLYNWHTLQEYKILLPNDIFIATGSWEVI